MRSNKISLIIMKDEGRTHRLRLGPKMLSIAVGILILIPIFSVLSVWLNIHLYSERSKIAQNRIELQYTVDQNSQTMARLTNLERFLENHSPGLLGLLVSQSNIDTMLIPTIGSKDEKLVKELKKLAMSNPIDIAVIAEKGMNKVDDKSKDEKPIKTTPLDNKKVPPKDTSISDGLPKEETNIPSIDLTKKPEQKKIPAENIEQDIDNGYVTLQNVKAYLRKNIISIQYYLRNTGRDIPLSGEQKYHLVSIKDGKIERIALTKVTNDNFRIRSMKIVESTISLPKIKIEEGTRIQIDVVRNDTVLFRKIYPLIR